MSQSPIRVRAFDPKSKAVDALPLADPKRLFEIRYKPSSSCTGKFEGEPGHGNFVLTKPGPEVVFRGQRFDLRKIHLHSETEHVVGEDQPHEMELHLIHAPKGSAVPSPLVVIGILFKVCRSTLEQALHKQAWERLIGADDPNRAITLKPLEFFPLLPDGAVDTVNWFHYEGSLTSYPYTENVSWFVMRSYGDITVEEIDDLFLHTCQHARELQPLERRLVVRSFGD